MAFSSVGVRRALTRSSSIINRSLSSIISSSSSLHHPSTENPRLLSPWFRSTSTSLASFSSRGGFQNNNNTYDDDKISPDTILFEGCDYNHWLITMDFRGQDPQPTPQEMVDTYVHTAAKVLGSVEEAKKKIYACSTTTYHGFQVEVSEEVSKKFEGLPGVVFILPDSYIDPVNKQYGGDQYINGTIIPRPPPVQYGRQGGRYGDRNRDRQREPYRQGDGRNFGPQQGYTQQQNHPQQHNYSQQQNYPPQGPQQNYPPQGPQQNYPPQGSQHIYPPQGPQQNYPPQRPQQNYPQQQNFQQQNSPPQGPQPQLNYTQPQTYPPQRYYSPQQNYGPTTPVERMDSRVDRNFAPSPRGGYGQGAEPSYGVPKWDGEPGSGAQWKDEK